MKNFLYNISMVNNITIATKHKGFTLIELLVIMSIIAILSSVFLPRFLDLDEKRADLVANELWTIAEAIQSYESTKGSFPGGDNCEYAIASLTMDNYLTGIRADETPWDAESEYITSCNADAAFINIALNDRWAQYVVNSLPQATVSSPASVILTVNKLAYVPVLKRFLYLDQSASNTTSPSGTYLTKGGIRVASPTDIVLLDRNTTDNNVASLARAVFYQELISLTSGASASIAMPTCINSSPTILAAINSIDFIHATTTTFNISSTPVIQVTTISTPISWGVNIDTTPPVWLVSIDSSPTNLITSAKVVISTKCQ